MTDPQAARSPARDIADRLSDEADLCRNDGANDIAALLDESVLELFALREQLVAVQARVSRLSAPLTQQEAHEFLGNAVNFRLREAFAALMESRSDSAVTEGD